MRSENRRVAVIGTGLIGRGWSIVFARAGYDVRMYDAAAGACEAAVREIAERVRDLQRYGLVDEPDAILSRLQPVTSLADATVEVELVQECVLETIEAKTEIFALLDRATPRTAIIASSSSAIPASAFTETLAGRDRCIIAHPANPPYLIPLVELVPSPWTSTDVVERATEMYRAAGQEPIVVRRELHGFILNRLQGALLCEAFRLVEDGYADTDAVDRAIAFGLGLRWSFMGPFETIDLNAPGGIADYARRYGPLYYEIARQAQARPWSDALVRQVESERRSVLPATGLAQRSAWRDKRLMLLAAHKALAAQLVDGEADAPRGA